MVGDDLSGKVFGGGGVPAPGWVHPQDPWSHRSEGMRCKTCMWFAPKTTDRPTKDIVGRCRRHAPTMNGYPVVFGADWCGDHKLDENRTD